MNPSEPDRAVGGKLAQLKLLLCKVVQNLGKDAQAQGGWHQKLTGLTNVGETTLAQGASVGPDSRPESNVNKHDRAVGFGIELCGTDRAAPPGSGLHLGPGDAGAVSAVLGGHTLASWQMQLGTYRIWAQVQALFRFRV